MKTKFIIKIFIGLLITLGVQSIYITEACSVATVSIKSGTDTVNVIGTRTSDLEFTSLQSVVKGLKYDKNTSAVNIGIDAWKNKATWINEYDYIGRSCTLKHQIIDGINREGLYVGMLNAPEITKYPEYNPADKRKAIGILDLANYLLGTSQDVPESNVLWGI